MSDAPLIVGWREWVSLPRLGIQRIKAKVDTGARTSALHADVEDRFDQDGVPMVTFVVRPDHFGVDLEIRVVAPVSDERSVRSSNGSMERRPFIVSDVYIGGYRWSVEFSLSSRESMGFPILLGRQALHGRAVVDPSRSYVLGKPAMD